jgi:hypothetical protein
MLRAASGIVIAIAALHAVSAHAQSERSDDPRPAIRRPPPSAPKAPDDDFCRASWVTAIDKEVCAHRTLLDKHLRVRLMLGSLNTLVGFPRTLRVVQMHKAWLDDRAKCTGSEVTACLHRLYDARVQELADSIATEQPSKP